MDWKSFYIFDFDDGLREKKNGVNSVQLVFFKEKHFSKYLVEILFGVLIFLFVIFAILYFSAI
jgi:hypothetical protein